MHPQAQLAAEAAQCAHAQDRFWDYHDKIFQNMASMSSDALKQHAIDLGLDTDPFNACLDSRQHQEQVAAEVEAGEALGVDSTPTFFVNGRFLSGALPFKDFQEIIDDELQRVVAPSS